MNRFIFVTFLFLGWAFYLLSDGADFQPRRPDIPVATGEPVTVAPPIHVVSNPPAPKPKPFSATALVAKPAIRVPDPVAAPKVAPPPTAQEQAYDDAVAAATLEQVRSSFGQGLNLFTDDDSRDPPLTLAALQQDDAATGAADPAAAPVAATPQPDRREITGTRVNMRDGPGTIYPVIVRLKIGQEVEVLGESGTGWLRLRSMPNQQIGWVSASLVSKAAR